LIQTEIQYVKEDIVREHVDCRPTSTSMDEFFPIMAAVAMRTFLCHQGAARTHQWGEMAKKRWQSDWLTTHHRGHQFGCQSALKSFSFGK
jgi:hypothetical protein